MRSEARAAALFLAPALALLAIFFFAPVIAGFAWHGATRFALLSIIILAIWRGFGFAMIIFIAALQQIPDELYEAARLDGAGEWRQFRHVTLPMLGPTFLFVGIVTAIGYL